MHTPARSALHAALVALLVVFAVGCDSASEEGTTTFIGTVVDAVTDAPVAAATVNVVGTAQTATTDGTGRFTLAVEADSTGAPIMLEAFASGYEPKSQQALAVVDQEVSIPDIVLMPRNAGGDGSDDDDDGSGGDGDNGGVDDGAEGVSGPAASITLVGRSSEAIAVTGAGADETATLTFVALDGYGNPVTTEHAVELNFAIGSGPGGGEFLTPAVVTTDASGRAQVTLSSGTAAGPVQIVATATVDGTELRSQPVTITITGGLPDDDHFSIAPENYNFPGYIRFGLKIKISGFVGDRYGNPVQPGTAVYFTTDGGIIEGSGVTGDLGMTSVELVSAEPLPSNPIECPTVTSPEGYAVVRARTSDENNQIIEATSTVLFSDESQIEIVTPGLEMGAFDFVVDDRFGHPLGPGTTIRVDADG
ncbi:MAG: hypothetical protein R3362_03900, partial [Rhodothermales bacterium]|nr:hypothetical protein [Rhodothermales bacterium]